jgi:hypothetical protein
MIRPNRSRHVVWQVLFLFLLVGAMLVSSMSVTASNKTIILNNDNYENSNQFMNSSNEQKYELDSQFIFEINIKNITENKILGNISTLLRNNDGSNNDTKSVFSAVELDSYFMNQNSNLTIMALYVNGTSEFELNISKHNISSYLNNNLTIDRNEFVIILELFTDYDNLTYLINKTLNLSDYFDINTSKNITINNIELNLTNNMTDELEKTISNSTIENISISYIEQLIKSKHNKTTEESFNLSAIFAENYFGRHIYGQISISENSTPIFETAEISISKIDTPSDITYCHANINGTGRFNCTLNTLKSGIYNITISTQHKSKLYVVSELTNIIIPKIFIELNHSINDFDNIDYSLSNKSIKVLNANANGYLGNELLLNENISIEITDPFNSTYLYFGIDPEINVLVTDAGNYTIKSSFEFNDTLYSKNVTIEFNSSNFVSDLDNDILDEVSHKIIDNNLNETKIKNKSTENILDINESITSDESNKLTEIITDLKEIYQNDSLIKINISNPDCELVSDVSIIDSLDISYKINPVKEKNSCIIEFLPAYEDVYTLMIEVYHDLNKSDDVSKYSKSFEIIFDKNLVESQFLKEDNKNELDVELDIELDNSINKTKNQDYIDIEFDGDLSDDNSDNGSILDKTSFTQLPAKAGESVKWIKKVYLENTTDYGKIVINKNAQNILVDGKTLSEQNLTLKLNGKTIDSSVLDEYVDANKNIKDMKKEYDILKNEINNSGFIKKQFTKLKAIVYENKIDNIINEIEEMNITNDPTLNVENLTKNIGYTISYETQAPTVTQKNISKNKNRVTISSDLHYLNVLTYANITEAPKEAIKLYWIKNGTRELFENVTYYDNNSNGLVEMISWVVPHLSDQVFEIDIDVLNVQSYPIIGGEWTVQFNTKGVANLTIRAIDKTTWDNHNETQDLLFKFLKCGNESINYEWINNGVFVEDYSCNQTGYETSKVISGGVHNLEFEFGGQKAYANNYAWNGTLINFITPSQATNVEQNKFTNITLNVTCGNETCGDINVSLNYRKTNINNWWNESWNERKNITISYLGSESLTDFPVLINVSKDTDMNIDYSDLRFTNGSCGSLGSELLSYEIENYTATHAIVWINLPILESPSTSVCMYYANSDAENGQDKDNVWNNYRGVFHLAESSGNALDSSPKKFNATNTVVTSQLTTGKIGPTYDWSTSGDRVDLPLNIFTGDDGASGLENFTVSFWHYIRGETTMFNLESGSHWELELWGTLLRLRMADNTHQEAGTQDLDYVMGYNSWELFTLSWQGDGNATLYHNGEIIANEISVGDHVQDSRSGDAPDKLVLGWNTDYGTMDGMLDEVRISSDVKSEDWIYQSYHMVQNQDVLVSTSGSEILEYEVPDFAITPMWTNETNSRTINLDSNETSQELFWVNFTGPISETYEMHATAVLLSDQAIFDSANPVNITIDKPVLPQSKNIAVEFVDPDHDVYVIKNSSYDMAVNLSCGNETCGDVNVSIKYRTMKSNWLNTDWKYRRNVTLSYSGLTSLSDFPAFINISKDIDMNSDFSDLRFTNGSCGSLGSELLSYEIENYTINNAIVWVRIPTIQNSSTDICMYYGNSDAENGQDKDNVWNNYRGVFHLAESSGNALDSSSKSYDSTNTVVTNRQSDGKIGPTYEFGNSGDRIDLPLNILTGDLGNNGLTDFTISFWHYTTDGDRSLFNLEDGSHWEINLWDDILRLRMADSSNQEAGTQEYIYPYSDNIWQYITIAWSGSGNFSLYQNGVLIETNESLGDHVQDSRSDDAPDKLVLGWNTDYGSMTGKLDEVRISSVERNSDWINLSYQQVENQDEMVTISSPESNELIDIPESSSIPIWVDGTSSRIVNLNSNETSQELFNISFTGLVSETYELFAFAYLVSDTEISNITSPLTISLLDDISKYAYSNVSLSKSIKPEAKGKFNISLEVENTGNLELTNITISDFVPNNFIGGNYSLVPTWNTSSNTYGGTILRWNLTTIPVSSNVSINYIVEYNGTDNIIDLRKFRLFGIANNLD